MGNQLHREIVLYNLAKLIGLHLAQEVATNIVAESRLTGHSGLGGKTLMLVTEMVLL